MPSKDTTPLSLYGNDREFLREQERTNELLADIAGETYESPGNIPNGKYILQKRMLDAAQKKNELLESIAGSGGGGGAAKGIDIDYGTDVISLTNKDGDPIQGSGATLPAYGVSFDPTTGGLTLTKNGTAMQGQTVTIPNYGSPVGVTDAADMVDEGTIYLYEGTTGGGFTNGHFYYYDGSAWADGGEYAAATVQTDKTLLVEDRAADAKATGKAVGELKTHFDVSYYNLYDVVNNSEVQSDPQFTVGTVYLNGYSGNLSISTAGTSANYIGTGSNHEITIYDDQDNATTIALSGTVKYNTSLTRSGKTFAVPSGSYKIIFRYRTYYSGGDLVKEVMVTEGDSIPEEYVGYEKTVKLKDSPYVTMDEVDTYVKTVAYMSPDGNDENNGLDKDHPVLTLDKAIHISSRICMKRGIYPMQDIRISNIDNISITPYDDNEEYSHEQPNRQKIEFVGANIINKSDLTVNDGIYSCEISGGAWFTEVFVNHTQDPVIDENAQKYRANVHVIYADISKKVKLKPVLSIALCEAESNTFYWDGTYVYCNISDTNFETIAVVTSDRGIRFVNCNHLYIEDVALKYAFSGLCTVSYSNDVKYVNCEASYCSVDMGFLAEYTDAEYFNCYATHNGYDGFNIHGYGTVNLHDCIAEYNYDDGCSHHNGNKGTIYGGRFTGNGKAGIAPAYGAEINIYNAFCNNNRIGIGYLSTNNEHAPMVGTMNSCLMLGNGQGLKVDPLCTIIAVNCCYSGNTTDKNVTGSLSEYPT